jgi:hypothetical protein
MLMREKLEKEMIVSSQVPIPVYKIECRRPKHGDEIVWYKRLSSFGFYGFEPCFTQVEYHWQDEDGTGVCYDGESEDEMYKEGYKLYILLDGYIVEPDEKYTPLDEWEKALDD